MLKAHPAVHQASKGKRRPTVQRPFRENRPLQWMVLWLASLWVLTAIAPRYARDWLLENLLVFASCGLLAFTYRRFVFSNLSYGLFTVFLSLHLVGAHYTYAEVPLGFWLQHALGFARVVNCGF